ncbi:MAG: hypothetical protein NVS4B12_04180 [Ktedonobacteraceae bacterium]
MCFPTAPIATSVSAKRTWKYVYTAPTATLHARTLPTQPFVAIVYVSVASRGTMFAFDPAHVTVKIVTQVIWTNRTNAPHIVSSDSGVFNSLSRLKLDNAVALYSPEQGVQLLLYRYLYIKAINTVMS